MQDELHLCALEHTRYYKDKQKNFDKCAASECRLNLCDRVLVQANASVHICSL
jgi:hypothetical protein